MADRKILWVALETTGVGKDGDFTEAIPTEVSAILTTDTMEPLAATYSVIGVTPKHAVALKKNPKVLQYLKQRKAIHKEGVTLPVADMDIRNMAQEESDDWAGEIILAGRGPEHFLRPVLQTHLPATAEFLGYYSFDTSQITRWFRFANGLNQLKSHRVKFDSDMEEILQQLPDATGSTMREILTEAEQLRLFVQNAEL